MKRERDDGVHASQSRRVASGYRQGPPQQQYQDRFASQGQHMASRLTTNDALGYLRDVKAKFAEHKETYDTFLEIMKKFKASSGTRTNTEGVIDQVKSLFRGHRELILGFNTFLPKGFEIVLPEEEEVPPKAAVEFDQAINYVNKIKTRFAHDERVYKNFLEILNMYRKGSKSIHNVYSEVSVLFTSHNDLLDEFTYFLPESGPAAMQHQARKNAAAKRGVPLRDFEVGRTGRSGKGLNISQELQWFDKVKHKLRNKESYQEFLKIINLYAADCCTKQEMVIMVTEFLSKHSELAHQFESLLNRLEVAEYDQEQLKTRGGGHGTRETRKGQAEKFGMRPISDMDVSTWERATTSYVKLPRGYPKLRASFMTAIGKQVLQDDWVSVTSGSEDYSFKHMRKNQYEEALFRCEDDRFEIDMVIECCRSAIRAFEKVSREISELSPEQRESYRLTPDKIKPIHFRVVQKMYGILPGERGAEMIDLLKKNPGVVIDVCLSRLHQKLGEWEKDQERMTPIWQKMYDANYHKSLDHRSFYFKQTDKRILGQKQMMQEVRDASEKRKAEDRTIHTSATNCSLHLSPDLTYNYKTSVIHEDLRKIVKYAVDEMLSPELSSRAAQLITDILEPFFGLSLRPFADTPRSASVSGAESLEQRIKNEEKDDRASPALANDEDAKENATGIDALGKIAGNRIDERASSEERADDSSDRDVREGTPAVKADVASPEEDSTEEFHSSRPVNQAGPYLSRPEQLPPCGRVLYGNEHFYILFRLHHYLFERLRTARRCALVVGDPAVRQKTEKEQDDMISELPPSAEEEHKKFMSLAYQVLDSRLDSSAYEDKCRSLLGTNSYTLFTLDKLLYKLVKQMQLILSDETSVRLLDLYRYEKARDSGVLDVTYYQNAHVILSEDMTFRFESTAAGDFTVQVLDLDRTEIPTGVIPPDFEPYFQQYTLGCAPLGAQPIEDTTIRRPYLKRSFPFSKDSDCEAEEERAMEHTELANALECKIMTKSSKVTYVLNTEDYFLRHKKRRRISSGPTPLNVKRLGKFSAWLETEIQKRPLPVPEPVPEPLPELPPLGLVLPVVDQPMPQAAP